MTQRNDHSARQEGARTLAAAGVRPPLVPDLAFRRFVEPADFAAMFAVAEGRRAWDEIDPDSTVESIPTLEGITATWSALPAETREQNLLFAEIAGQVVGYSAVDYWPEADGTWLYQMILRLLPAWRTQEIDRTLLRWAESRARALAADPAHPGPAVYTANATSTEREFTALLAAEGYQPFITLIEMGFEGFADLPPAPPLPPGLELRAAGPADYRAIWEARQAAYRGTQGFQETTEEQHQEFAGNPQNDPALWQIVWDAHGIAGMCLAEIYGARGVIPELNVRPDWRRRGLGRVLMVRGLRALADRGAQTVRLHTWLENEQRSFDLYAALGFRTLKQSIWYRKPLRP